MSADRKLAVRARSFFCRGYPGPAAEKLPFLREQNQHLVLGAPNFLFLGPPMVPKTARVRVAGPGGVPPKPGGRDSRPGPG